MAIESGRRAPNLKSPLGHVLGLGSARNGTEHFWAQRLTAMALIPLAVWFALSLLSLTSLDYYAVSAWMARPLNAVLVLLLVLVALYHSSLGTQVVVEDYVHAPALKITTLAVLRILHVALALAGAFAVFSVSVGGAG